MHVIKYAFQQHGDERGMLVALEEFNDIPFEIKRVNNSPFKALSEKEVLDKLSKSREHAEQGLFQEASAVSAEMRTKYGI